MFADEYELIDRIAVALIRRRERIGTAESCTGGLIAAACTSLSGSSEWFERGVVSYSNEAKSELLGVPKGLIALHGSVSAEVAEHMARGLLAHAPIDWALSVTGIAGPTGGSEAKPVGTVWLGLAWTLPRATQEGLPAGGAAPRVDSRTECLHLDGDRAAIRAQTVAIALQRLVAAATSA